MLNLKLASVSLWTELVTSYVIVSMVWCSISARYMCKMPYYAAVLMWHVWVFSIHRCLSHTDFELAEKSIKTNISSVSVFSSKNRSPDVNNLAMTLICTRLLTAGGSRAGVCTDFFAHCTLAIVSACRLRWSVGRSPKRQPVDHFFNHLITGQPQRFLVSRVAWISDQSVFIHRGYVSKLSSKLQQVWTIPPPYKLFKYSHVSSFSTILFFFRSSLYYGKKISFGALLLCYVVPCHFCSLMVKVGIPRLLLVRAMLGRWSCTWIVATLHERPGCRFTWGLVCSRSHCPVNQWRSRSPIMWFFASSFLILLIGIGIVDLNIKIVVMLQ